MIRDRPLNGVATKKINLEEKLWIRQNYLQP